MEAELAPVLAAVAVCLAAAAAALRVDETLAERLPVSPHGVGWGRRLRRSVRWIGEAAPLRALPGRGGLSRRIALAGWAVPEEELVGWKALLAASLAILALLAPAPVPLLAPVLAVAGFRLPDLAVAAAARRRMERADREVPLLLDLLAAASSAGLSGQLAFRRAVEAGEGPLAQELSAVLRSVDLGARWRDELRSAAERLELSDLRRAVATITRAESLGSSLSDALSDLATQVRDAKRAAASERARKAPVKMLFPLVFLVLPAFLLLTVVPVLVTTLQALR